VTGHKVLHKDMLAPGWLQQPYGRKHISAYASPILIQSVLICWLNAAKTTKVRNVCAAYLPYGDGFELKPETRMRNETDDEQAYPASDSASD
jgi:hypothetical protein